MGTAEVFRAIEEHGDKALQRYQEAFKDKLASKKERGAAFIEHDSAI